MTLTPGSRSETPAGPSVTSLTPGPSSYHESSQFLHWRYSPSGLASIREELNAKSVELVARNTELEKEAQKSLGHVTALDPPLPSTYLTVTDVLLLLRFYCSQISKICRHGFGLPEVVESTAITYLKRFYLKNSVMEWHPKSIMPTCLFLAAKTTNYPVLIDTFIPKFAKLTQADVIDTEFLVAQSLGFEFWVRGAEKALRGWSLDMQNQPNAPIDAIQKALPAALNHLSTSRLTDAEFIYTPSQISLAAWRLANPSLVDTFLEERYSSSSNPSAAEDDFLSQLYGIEKTSLLQIVGDIEKMIKEAEGEVDMKKVKEVDKRLKQCTNPEKVPGTALYIKRKQERDSSEAASKAAKWLKAQAAAADRESVFGDIIDSKALAINKLGNGISPIPAGTGGNVRQPLSPRVTLPSPGGRARVEGGEVKLEDRGMGLQGESGGYVLGGKGLKDVGLPLADD